MKLTKKEIKRYLDDLNKLNFETMIKVDKLEKEIAEYLMREKIETFQGIFKQIFDQPVTSDFSDCKIKPKEFINEAANIIANFHMHSDYIPDALQMQIDSWLKSFTSGEIKTWRSK